MSPGLTSDRRMPSPADEIRAMLPSLFRSHAAPTLPLSHDPARASLIVIAERLDRPKALLAASAHCHIGRSVLNAVEQNATIHCFYVFPPLFYQMTYPAPGS